MTDIFFSYSSVDRERVRQVRDALAAQGFEVFWDQQVPAGVDWDPWIRQHLASCKCAMVFWSSASITSRNVRHEATIADQEGKLIPVLLESLNPQQFPMGLYAQQAANLADWDGDLNHQAWDKLRRDYETKLMPHWVRQRMDEKDAELVAERARRQAAERRDKTLQAQIAKEAETQQELKREHDTALDQIAALKTTVEELTRARSEAEARETDTLHQVATLKVAVDEVTRARAEAEQRLSKTRQIKAKEIVQSVVSAFSLFVVTAAVATAGFWTYQLIWPASQPVVAVTSGSTPEAEQQRLTAIKEEEERQARTAELEAKLKTAEAEQERLTKEVQRQATAATDADSKRKAAEVEQQRLKDEIQRLTKAAGDVEAKLKAAEIEQQRLKEEVQRQSKLATDADAKRRGTEAEQQRLIYELRKAAGDAEAKLKAAEIELQRLKEEKAATKQVALPQAFISTLTAPSFEPRPNTEGIGRASGIFVGTTVEACKESCSKSGACQAFTFNKTSNLCSLFDALPLFRSNSYSESGVRQPAALSQSTGTVIASPFESRPNMEGMERLPTGTASTSTVGACEEKCTGWNGCRAYTFNKATKYCSVYDMVPAFRPNAGSDSGVRRNF